jgi:acyl-CoA dehydrogenase
LANEGDVFDDIIRTVRDFVRNEVVPLEDEIENSHEIPERLRAAAAEMGLFGWALPEEYGGLGLNMRQDVRLAIELGWTTPAFRSMLGTNNGIAGKALVNFGDDEQKQRWLPRLASGEAVASFALTEDGAGSDPSGVRTRAVRDGADWVLNGAKRFITNASRAQLLVVFARTATDPETPANQGMSAFLVETDRPGVTVSEPDVKMGQHGSVTNEVGFTDVRVPASALLGAEGDGFSAAMASLTRGRLHIAGICVGQAERAQQAAVEYAATATQGGRSISRFQLVQGLLAESQAELFAGRSMVHAAAEAFDDGSDTRIGPSSAKLFCSEMLGRVADRAVQVYGGMGYMHGAVVERIYRDARLFRIYEGTSEIQKVIIAKQLLRGAAG